MEIIHFNSANFPVFEKSIISIGSFDGVHQGHARIISRLVKEARSNNVKSILISFDKHPRQILDNDNAKFKLLSTLDEKKILLDKYQIDYLVIVPFTLDFAQLRPEDYIENFLIKYFNPKKIILGFDHRFGVNGSGDIHLLKNYTTRFNFELIEIPKLEIEQNKISSTKIRQFINSSNIIKAVELLGHPYLFIGKVKAGDKIGRKMGYPTANIEIDQTDKLIPPDGIYVAKVKLEGLWYNAMLYIGSRPTIGENLSQHIELSLYDFHDDLYGKILEVYVIDYVRHDLKFDNLEKLKNQIEKDEKNIANKLLKYDILNTGRLDNFKIAVVILNYNGLKYLENYLQSILQNSIHHAELYIIDNNSTDGSIQYIEQHFPEIKIIKLKQNYGYAGGYTHGLNQIDADYYALINSDIFIDHQWLDPIIQLLQSDPLIMAVQPKILSINEPDKFEYAGAAGGLIDALGIPFCYGRIFDHLEVDQAQYNTTCEIFWSSGAAMVVNAKLFRALGGFDENYFAHQEEIDLCWRIKRCGGKIVYEPNSKVFHLGGGTLDYENPRKTFLNYRNNLVTIIKNNSIKRCSIIIIIRFILDSLTSLRFLIQGKPKNAIAILKAYYLFLRNLNQYIKLRNKDRKQIERIKFNKRNKKGLLKGTILWQYFVLEKKEVSLISTKKFHE